MDAFIQLGGVTTCLKIIAMAYDWTFPGRAEMVRSALDTLLVCSVVPRVQLQFCERIELLDDNRTFGISIILSAAEGEIVQVSIVLVEVKHNTGTEDSGLEASQTWLTGSITFGEYLIMAMRNFPLPLTEFQSVHVVLTVSNSAPGQRVVKNCVHHPNFSKFSLP